MTFWNPRIQTWSPSSLSQVSCDKVLSAKSRDGVDFRLRDGRIRTQRAATGQEELQVDLLMSLQNRLEEVLEGAILGMGDRDLTELTVGEIELPAGRVIGDLDHLLFEEPGGGHIENEERQQMERNHEDPGASPGLEEAPDAVRTGCRLGRQESFSLPVLSRIQPAARPAAKTMGSTTIQMESFEDSADAAGCC